MFVLNYNTNLLLRRPLKLEENETSVMLLYRIPAAAWYNLQETGQYNI